MTPQADTGNPNVFTTFKGRYQMVAAEGCTLTNSSVMLSCINTVQFLGECILTGYTAGDCFATLPLECVPKTEIRIPIVISCDNDCPITRVEVLTIDDGGNLSVAFSGEEAIIHLTGCSFNVSDNWYRS